MDALMKAWPGKIRNGRFSVSYVWGSSANCGHYRLIDILASDDGAKTGWFGR